MPNYTNRRGNNYTEEEIQAGANRKGMQFDDYISRYGISLQGIKQEKQEQEKPKQENVNWFDQTWFGRGFAAASTTGEATDLLLEFDNVNIETVQEFIEAKEEEARNYVASERMDRFQEKYKKEGSTWSAFFRGVKRDPMLMAELFVQSLGTQIGTAFDAEQALVAATGGAAVGAGIGAAATAYGFGIGAIPGGLAGAFGGLATSMEAALTFGELIEKALQDKGQEFTDVNIKALLESPEGKSIRNKAIGRGLTIGAIEGMTGGIAGKTTTSVLKIGKIAGRSRKVLAGAAGTGVEAVGGGLGEVGGRLVAGQEMDPAEIGFEAITGTITAPGTVGYALLTHKKAKYILNKKEVSYAEMKDFVDTADDIDVAKANIKMENDVTGLELKAAKKQNRAITNSQIDNKITDQKDRDELIKLDAERRKAKADLKKEGVNQVPGAEQKLEIIEDKISNIISKYEGAVDVAVTEGAADIRKTRRDISLVETIDFLQKNKKFVGKDVVIAEDNASAQEAYNKAVEEYNSKQTDPKNMIEAADVTDADGFVVGDVIVVNKDVAGRKGAINVGAHELLHAIMGKHMKTLSDAGKIKLGKSFMDVLTKDQDIAVRKRLKESYGLEGDNVFQSEEIFTAFSDAITKGDITFNEGVFSKLKNIIQKILSLNGYIKEFANGRQVYNFLKDYQKSIAAGGEISTRAKRLAGGGTSATTAQASISKAAGAVGAAVSYRGRGTSTRGELIDDINDLQKGATTKAEFQKSDIFNNVFKSLESGGAVNNYIRSLQMSPEKTQETIDAVTDRLINFNPEAKRKDGTVIGPRGLGEFMMANVGFGKLDAAKALAIKGKKTKREVKIDSDEVKELASEITETPENEKNIKFRKLKDFDIELDNGLLDAEIVVQIEALIEKNPDNIQEQFDSLINKEFRKILDNSVGKIQKVKGKMVISPDYEVFIRNEYAEIVQSLGIKEIRTSYKNWFEKKRVGTEDVKGVSSVTGKVTNFRKGIFENSTNKVKYIKYFTEGGFTTLRERRSALLKRIAKRKAENVVDNYIQENSINIDALVKAKLRQLSKTADNVLNEQKSFDTVKFSKNFINNYEVLKSKLKKVGTKWVYKKKFIKDAVLINNKPQEFQDLGRVWEQAFANHFLTMDITDFKVISEFASEIGGMADFVFEYLGRTENHELKASITAFMGSVAFSNFNFKNGTIGLATDVHNSLLTKEAIAGIKKAYKLKIDYLNKRIKELNDTRLEGKKYDLLTYDITSGKPQYAPYELFNEEGFGNKLIYQQKSDQSVIQNQYIAKGVNSISFVGTKFGSKSFRLSNDSILNLPMLLADTLVNFTFRNPGSVIRKGEKMRAVKLGIQFKISKLKNNLDSTPGIHEVKALKKALGVKASKSIGEAKIFNKAVNFSRSSNNPTKGITVLDFDDTLATSKSLIRYTKPDGNEGTLTPEQYASSYQNMQDLDYEFDFSEFNKVVDGKTAPLFQKALKLQKKFGPENMFVLTARPAESAPAIFAFIKANGLNIPLKNITGLANSTAEAKALWMAEKVGEGFNDFYFADDALQNVQAVKNMLEQFDVKSKVQQAKVKFSKSMNDQFNDILENIKGIESEKRFDFIKARKRGASKGKFRYFVPPSHEDFVGLLYNFIGRGKEGNAHRDFFEKALVRPLNRANKEYDTARQSVATDYKNLNKQMPDVKKQLTKKTPDGDFTYQDAIRIYLWDKHGYDIPGLSPVDQKNLVELVNSDPNLKSYAETVNTISKQETYVNPTDGWDSGDIRMDLDDATGRIGRAQFFEEFNENADIIFSTENLNKIEAGYGKGVREALEDMLYRVKTGTNRPSGQNKMVNALMNWVNGSVGAVMFFNMRSALLQQMSLVNYINFADNNIFAAAKAFANQKQYWTDWAFIFNSDMLKQRRGGIQTDVNGAELAADMRKSKNPWRFLISKLLKLGFLPTQIGDNIAIATGGASYYRNRINTYLKQGLSQKEAEAKAFTDFQDITQSTQQSARPDMVSQQQASVIGKIILNFQNVTSQFNRLGKKAFQDIYNRRITKPNTTQLQSDISNASRITYYFAVQNLIFYTLQTALFAMMFDDDEEDNNKLFLKKKERLINGSIDSVLRGTGMIGAVVATLKNVAIAFARQRDVDYNPDESAVLIQALNLSPVIGIKARKISNAEKTLNYNKKVIKEMETFDIDNPQWSAATNYIEAGTNIPLNRLYNKTQNVRQALNNDHAAWERALLITGWSQYNLDLENKKMDAIKESTKTKGQKKKSSRGGSGRGSSRGRGRK